jgi:malonyl-CoA O-methyltransferase
MAGRIELLTRKPQRLAVWWPHPAEDPAPLQAACRGATRVAVRPEFAARPAGEARGPWGGLRRLLGRAPVPTVSEDAVEAGAFDLVWANMMLHAAVDPQPLIARWHRALAVDGCLMFSTLGPGTLPELRGLFADHGWGPSLAPLVDMHDLGDMLVRAGFADPVMDQESITLTWPDASAALLELRSLGRNADPGRFAGLRTPGWKRRLVQALDDMASRRADGRVALTFEVAYGHAWRVAPRVRGPSEVTVDLETLRATARSHPPRPPHPTDAG